jgi:hypothetical protein
MIGQDLCMTKDPFRFAVPTSLPVCHPEQVILDALLYQIHEAPGSALRLLVQAHMVFSVHESKETARRAVEANGRMSLLL